MRKIILNRVRYFVGTIVKFNYTISYLSSKSWLEYLIPKTNCDLIYDTKSVKKQ